MPSLNINDANADANMSGMNVNDVELKSNAFRKTESSFKCREKEAVWGKMFDKLSTAFDAFTSNFTSEHRTNAAEGISGRNVT